MWCSPCDTLYDTHVKRTRICVKVREFPIVGSVAYIQSLTRTVAGNVGLINDASDTNQHTQVLYTSRVSTSSAVVVIFRWSPVPRL